MKTSFNSLRLKHLFEFKLYKRCRFSITCIPYAIYKKVNPSSQILIDGQCSTGCSTSSPIIYAYTLYFTTEANLTLSSKPTWFVLNNTNGYLSGKDSSLEKYKLKNNSMVI